jgi:hypothetical protein
VVKDVFSEKKDLKIAFIESVKSIFKIGTSDLLCR